jgi:hypothetical protein
VIAHCLASEPPDALLASSDEPALVARVERRGPRTWRIGCELEGTPSRRLASVRVLERRAGGEATAGIVTVSLPTSRVGEVRMSGDAEPVAGGLARAWLLIATEASRAMRVRSLRARSGSDPAWRQEYADDAHGSHLWIECTYPRTAAHDVVDLDVEVGSRTERISAVLPPLRDGGTASGGPGR